jgi:hypothetical protein
MFISNFLNMMRNKVVRTSAHITRCMKSLAFSFFLPEEASALSCSRLPARRIARAASRTASVEFASPARHGFLASSRRCRPKATASFVDAMPSGMLWIELFRVRGKFTQVLCQREGLCELRSSET